MHGANNTGANHAPHAEGHGTDSGSDCQKSLWLWLWLWIWLWIWL